MDSIELRQRRGSLRPQHDTAFPRNSAPSRYPTSDPSTGHHRQHLQPVTYARVPNDDENFPEYPLLSSRMWNALSADRHDQESGRDRKVSVEDQLSSRSDEDYPRETHAIRPQPGEAGRATGRTLVRKHIARGGWARYLNGMIVHMPALLMTAVILAVGSVHFYWYSEQGPLINHKGGDYRLDADIISNVLQFVAKLHELFIIASLSSVTLAMFRRSLVTRGIHLGFLTGGYRVADLAYLKSAAFWRQGLDTSNVWGILLPGFLVLATLMSTIVGPASAILLVPSLGWYKIEASVAFSKIELPLLYKWDKNNIWMPHRDNAPDRCKEVQGLYQGFCPGGGFPEISNWLEDFPATGLANDLTFHSTSADLRRHIVFTEAKNMANTTIPGFTTLCTTPPQFLTDSIGLFQKYIDSGDVGVLSREPRYRLRTAKESHNESAAHDNSTLFQPFIQSKCNLYDKEQVAKSLSSDLHFPLDSLNCLNNSACQRVQKKGWVVQKDSMPGKDYDNTSVATPFFSASSSPIVLIRGQVPDTLDGQPRHFFYLCSLLASLVPSNFTLDPRVSDVLQSSSSTADAMQNIYRLNDPDIRVVSFTKEWFKALDPTWDEKGRSNVTALWRLVQNFASKEGKHQMSFVERHSNFTNFTSAETFLAKVFGAVLTEGLARSTLEQRATLLVLEKDGNRSVKYIDLSQRYGSRTGVHELTFYNSTHHRHDWGNRTTYDKQTVAEFMEKLETYLPIGVVAERYGYGSGQQRATLHWAQAVMGVYLAIVVIYASWVVIMSVLDAFGLESNHGQARVLSIVPWSDLQDLIILALRTPPPDDEDLADAGAGVSSSRIWKKTVWAGADGDSNAQLVLGKGQSVGRLQVDRSAQYY
ncbi:hypothetical protein CSOJ01_13351 [Colletotrichum sojae]|uniref:Uncharacterized protein n=1 Tax=Colletotrichum sojae TaxID=2175907 RepID=A0A8H6IT58_9PEZI|nr:hypothetical protein CSOJ01_13351 [Colletotrichum sojae]